MSSSSFCSAPREPSVQVHDRLITAAAAVGRLAFVARRAQRAVARHVQPPGAAVVRVQAARDARPLN